MERALHHLAFWVRGLTLEPDSLKVCFKMLEELSKDGVGVGGLKTYRTNGLMESALGDLGKGQEPRALYSSVVPKQAASALPGSLSETQRLSRTGGKRLKSQHSGGVCVCVGIRSSRSTLGSQRAIGQSGPHLNLSKKCFPPPPPREVATF